MIFQRKFVWKVTKYYWKNITHNSVGIWRMVGRGRKEKDLMVGQIIFYVFCCCVVRMDGFVQNRINEFVQRQIIP